nr:MAG TPA: hypothetical protein [Caudoviricetes sp.]
MIWHDTRKSRMKRSLRFILRKLVIYHLRVLLSA